MSSNKRFFQIIINGHIESNLLLQLNMEKFEQKDYMKRSSSKTSNPVTHLKFLWKRKNLLQKGR